MVSLGPPAPQPNFHSASTIACSSACARVIEAKGRTAPCSTPASLLSGPGAYNIASPSGVGPKYSMRGRGERQKKATDSPGPGQYDVNESSRRSPTTHRFTGRAKVRPLEDTPGPGEYDVAGRYRGGFSLYGRVKFGTAIGSALNDNPGRHEAGGAGRAPGIFF